MIVTHAQYTNNISIHALREEGDLVKFLQHGFDQLFLSTPSVRRATFCAFLTIRILTHFYPRPP